MAPSTTSVAIVTGGASGIGEESVRSLAHRGWTVVVADLDIDRAHHLATELVDDGAIVEAMATDVTDPDACQRLVGTTVERHGRLDAAVNNAGISGALLPTADYPVDEWRRVLTTNLDGTFYCLRSQLPVMQRQGHGRVVNVASILGAVGFAGLPAYVAAKHGVVGLTKQVAQEYAAQGLRVNAVGPGFVRTPLLDRPEMTDELIGMLEQMHPIGRLGAPDEIGEVVAWLCSDAPAFLNGAYIPVDGGYLTR